MNKEKAGHTPGPWHCGMNPGPMVYGKLGEQIADCRDSDESGYNARLIAAAPELLESLKTMSKSFHHNGKHSGYFADCDSAVCEENRQLIAKAEGR